MFNVYLWFFIVNVVVAVRLGFFLLQGYGCCCILNELIYGNCKADHQVPNVIEKQPKKKKLQAAAATLVLK